MHTGVYLGIAGRTNGGTAQPRLKPALPRNAHIKGASQPELLREARRWSGAASLGLERGKSICQPARCFVGLYPWRALTWSRWFVCREAQLRGRRRWVSVHLAGLLVHEKQQQGGHERLAQKKRTCLGTGSSPLYPSVGIKRSRVEPVVSCLH